MDNLLWSRGFICKNSLKKPKKLFGEESIEEMTANLGTVSLKHLGVKTAPNLVYFIKNKELLNFSEMALWLLFHQSYS